MKSITVFVIALIAINATNLRRPLGAKQQKQALLEMDQNPVVNMIMSQLQIHLAAGGPVDDLMNLVQEFINNCNDSQAAADGQHNEDVAVCDFEICTSWAKYEHHTASHETAVQTVADTQGLLAQAEDDLASTIQNIADLEGYIAVGTALRADQAAEYAVTQAMHQASIDALDEALSLVSAMYHSPGSFLQLQSKMESATAALKELSHLSEFELYAPIIESLAQLSSTTLAGDAVMDILDLLVKLRDQIQATKDEETALENLRIANWATELSHLTNQLNNAKSRKANLENNIENYHQVIDTNEAAAIMHASEAARFFDLHAAWVQDCDEKQRAYDSFTAANQGDLAVLTRFQDYLVDAFSSVEDYIVERANE